MTREKEVYGCIIEALDNDSCRSILNWVINGEEPYKNKNQVNWLLAYCHDGVTWGRLEGEKSWCLSSMFFPDLSPCISDSNLLEIRIFGPESEFLIWRTGDEFSGRGLIDIQEKENVVPFQPDDEIRIMLGDRMLELPKGGFTRVGINRGMEHAVPLECMENDFVGGIWPLRLKMRHYFEEDPETGALRVAASRFVNVFKEVR